MCLPPPRNPPAALPASLTWEEIAPGEFTPRRVSAQATHIPLRMRLLIAGLVSLALLQIFVGSYISVISHNTCRRSRRNVEMLREALSHQQANRFSRQTLSSSSSSSNRKIDDQSQVQLQRSKSMDDVLLRMPFSHLRQKLRVRGSGSHVSCKNCSVDRYLAGTVKEQIL
eukprot:TRINITY_DN4602_c0_g1_i1.p1 TRINITY_DN4602_c0_g1~~TRINITY_DN4602_c0_g1_i1.p1  ORF type:complete len:170 (-),score=28.23 TRINITY_DN4602_c0_g1_i1:94-603(-)